MQNKKFIGLGLAAAMMAATAGCAMSTPATVGTIGEVEIPAGVYLLTQYNAYGSAAGKAELAEGVTANDVAKVLKSNCTSTVGSEEVSGTVEQVVAKQTTYDLQRYAAVETRFAELGGELTDSQKESIASSASNQWSAYGESYTANGIGQPSVEKVVANSMKAGLLLDMVYGEDGVTPVSDEEYTKYINEECTYFEEVELPLFDYSTYVFASEDQKAEVQKVADELVNYLTEQQLDVVADNSAALVVAAGEYVPKALEALGSEMNADEAQYYCSAGVQTPKTMQTYYGDTMVNALDAAKEGEWISVDMGMYIIVCRKLDPAKMENAADTIDRDTLLHGMKEDALNEELAAAGAALPQNLDSKAISTYSAANIKRS